MIERLRPTPSAAYDARVAEMGEEVARELERRVILSVLDRKWREHLYEMDYLREGIYLRAYSQRDPLVEYQREGFDMFAAMMDGIKEETVGFLFNLEVTVDDQQDEDEDEQQVLTVAPGLRSPVPGQQGEAPHIHAKGLDAPSAPQNLTYSAPAEDGEAEVRADVATARTPTPGSAATPPAPAGRARSSSSATAPPVGPTGTTARAQG